MKKKKQNINKSKSIEDIFNDCRLNYKNNKIIFSLLREILELNDISEEYLKHYLLNKVKSDDNKNVIKYINDLIFNLYHTKNESLLKETRIYFNIL